MKDIPLNPWSIDSAAEIGSLALRDSSPSEQDDTLMPDFKRGCEVCRVKIIDMVRYVGYRTMSTSSKSHK